MKRFLIGVLILLFTSTAYAGTLTRTYTAIDDEVLDYDNLNSFMDDLESFINGAEIDNGNIEDGTLLNAELGASAAIDDSKIEGGTTDATLSSMMTNYRIGTRIYENATTSFKVDTGRVRVNGMNKDITTAITVTGADLDTGDLAEGYYYIYATGDTSDNNAAIAISASSTTPTDITNYRRIGWLRNGPDGDTTTLDIEATGDDDYGSCNQYIEEDNEATTSTGATWETIGDNDELTAYHVSDGIRKTKITLTGRTYVAPTEVAWVGIDVDGTVKASQAHAPTGHEQTVYTGASWTELLSAGGHTILGVFQSGDGTAVTFAAASGSPGVLIVED